MQRVQTKRFQMALLPSVQPGAAHTTSVDEVHFEPAQAHDPLLVSHYSVQGSVPSNAALKSGDPS